MAVTGYEIRINGATVIDAGDVLTYLVTNLEPNTEYDFEVRSYNEAGQYSAWSNIATATTPGFVLDEITATPFAAYSVRKLRAGYTGPALRVNKISTSTQSDLACNFTKATVDALGSQSDIEIVKWYDQSGNGNDLTFNSGDRPLLAYLSAPMVDFGRDNIASMGGTSEDAVSITQLKLFAAVDAPVSGGSYLVTFGDSLKFATYVQADWKQNNGSAVVYGKAGERGSLQVSSLFVSGTDTLRINGVEISKTSGTNAGDTAVATETIRVARYINGGGLGFIGRIGEIILFDPAVSDPNNTERDAIESSQMHKFMDGIRLIIHGDSISYGVGILPDEDKEFEYYGAVIRDILGEGADCYRRATPGWTWNDMNPEIGTIIAADIRANAEQNIVLVQSGYNDLQGGGITAAQWQTRFQDYCTDFYAENFARTKLFVSSVFPSEHGGLSPTFMARMAEVNDWLKNYAYDYCDGYIDTTEDANIGSAADATNTTYFYDGIHLDTAGYALWGQIAAEHIDAFLYDNSTPSVPSGFTATGIGDGRIQIDYTQIPVATDIIERYELRVNGGIYTNEIINIRKAATYIFQGALSTAYNLEIRSVTPRGVASAWSSVESVTTDASLTQIPTTSLVNHWNADSLNGTLNDGDAIGSISNSSSGAAATQSDAAKKPILKKNIVNGLRSVMRFDGSNDWLTTTDSNRTAFTLVIVCKTDVDNVQGAIIGGSSSKYILANSSGSANELGTYFGTSYLSDTGFDTTGQWSHIVITYDGTTCKGFYNGTENWSRTETAAWEFTDIGSYAGGLAGFFDGDINQIAEYSVAKTGADLTALFDALDIICGL